MAGDARFDGVGKSQHPVFGFQNRGIVMSDESDVEPPVEFIPSVPGEISAIASAHALFLYFENAFAFARLNGIIRVTLSRSRHSFR